MRLLVRAVVSGFGFSLGNALFKRVSKQLGLDDSQDKSETAVEEDIAEDGEPEPA